MDPTLNWQELEILVNRMKPTLEGKFLDRIFIPERKIFPAAYLKEEWALRFTERKQECDLLISIRPRRPYLAISPEKLRASATATHSPFDLYLSKTLCGMRLHKLETLHQERIAIFWFRAQPNTLLGLVLVMIPARPEALLISTSDHADYLSTPWRILTRSRFNLTDEFYHPPEGFKAPRDLPLRKDLVENPEQYALTVVRSLNQEAFLQRIQLAEKSLKQSLKQAQERLELSKTQLKEASREPDWQKWGDLLKSALGTVPEKVVHKTATYWKVMDYETQQWVEIPSDPQLELTDQVKRYYENAKRKQRRMQEATLRIERFQEISQTYENAFLQKPPSPTADSDIQWATLEQFERIAGTSLSGQDSSGLSNAIKKNLNKWSGKSFISKDGYRILVGRNKDENLELSFKIARGNDIWMHVRGKPGAHVVIPLPPGKSAPLETLLDAAQLTLHYSHGKEWGKTEVDYTFKKYVKRIRNSTEAAYTHNKTLIISPDSPRIQRLMNETSPTSQK